MKEGNEIKLVAYNRQKLMFIVLGLYSVLAALVSFFWTGSFLSLFFLLSAVAIFLLALFFPLVGFFALLVFRTSFDYLGSVTELFNFFGVSVNLNFLLGIILIVLAGLELFKQKANLVKLRFFWPWLLFLIINIVLSFFSFDKAASLINFFRLLSFFSAFVFGYFIFNDVKKITSLIKVIIFSAIIPVAVAWWQLISGLGFFDGSRWRLVGTFTHPNMLAIYLVLIICLTLFVALNLRKGSVVKVPYILLAIFFIIPLAFTYTRIAWITLAFIFFAVGVYRFRKLLILGVISVVLVYFFVPVIQERLVTLFGTGVTDSSSWRLSLWRDLINYIMIKPWFGYGPGTAAIFVEKNIPRFLAETEPHNDYLRVLLESGIFALISYLWIFVDYLKRLWQGFKIETRPRFKMLIMFLVLFVVGMGGASLTDNVLKDAVMQWDFWVLSGGLLAIIKTLPKKKESHK